MRTNKSLGIYFENDRIDLVCVKRSFQGMVMQRSLSVHLSKEADQQEPTYKEIATFIKKTKGTKLPLTIGLPRKDVICINLELPTSTEENLWNVIGYELDRHTPYSKEDAYFDFQITERDKEKKNIRVIVFVVFKKSLDGIFEMIHKMQLHPMAVEISSTALLRTFYHNEDNVGENRILLLHRCEKNNEVLLIQNRSLHYSRTFAVDSPGNVAKISAELHKVLDHHSWHRESIKKIVVSGEEDDSGNTFLSELAETMQYQTTSFESFYRSSKGPLHSSNLLVPFGLALRAFEKETDTIDLKPPVKETKDSKRSYWATALLGLLVIVLGSAVLATPILQGEAAFQTVSKQLAQLRGDVESLKRLEGQLGKAEKHLSQLKLIEDPQARVLPWAKALSEMIPDKTWLTDVRYKRNVIEISGYSFASSSLISTLERSPLFAEVAFSAPVTIAEERRNRLSGNRRRRTPFLKSGDPEPDPTKIVGLEQFKIKAHLERDS